MKLQKKFLTCNLVLALLGLCSCAGRAPAPEPELEFKPIQLRWIAIPEELEMHPAKDACVIQITSLLMQHPVIQNSKNQEFDYQVTYGASDGNLVFEGIESDYARKSLPEFRWTGTCGKDLPAVVNFHNAQ